MDKESDNKPRILLICRDLDSASRLCANLAVAGWNTVEVTDPLEAIGAVKSLNISLVLLCHPSQTQADLDLISVLRKVSASQYLPVLVLADNPSTQHRCMMLDWGVDDILPPDVSINEMLARTKSLLRLRELQDQLEASRSALLEALARERKLMTKLRKDNEHLQALATTDPLTRLQNVRSFHGILDHEFLTAKRYNQPLSLLMLDVDHFKIVNDTHGHPAGDVLLKDLAVILTRSVRESDVVARIGGEEFGIILPRADHRRAALFAARIRREVAAHEFNAYSKTVRVTISIGACSFPSDAEVADVDMLVFFADQALLNAKDTGRDRVVAVSDLDMSIRRRLRRQFVEIPIQCMDDGEQTVPVHRQAVVVAATAGPKFR